jgi:tetratricopeptide (TPR) repeat protein
MDTIVQKSLVQIMWKTLEQEGTESAIKKFRNLKVNKFEYAYSEGEINRLGYNLLSDNKVDQAVEIFKLNMEEFPNSSNVYDSYGEALLKKGLKDEAATNYKKSLELNPGNTNAVEKLKEMGVATVQPAGMKLNEDELKEYSGKYQLAPQFIITVTTNGTQIFAQATGQPQFEIFALTRDKFFLKVVDAQIGFLRREGKITSMILFQNGREMPGKKIE